VDGQSIAEFEANLSGNLYKLWSRLSSGSYFPPPVRRVDIPKADGGTRPLGVPTVSTDIRNWTLFDIENWTPGLCDVAPRLSRSGLSR
jgi:hypothetical protein